MLCTVAGHEERTVENPKRYHRVLLKVSGEYFCDAQGIGISHERIVAFARVLKPVIDQGIQLAIVVGAGNICRGKQFVQAGFDQVSADHMGMIATTLNAIAMANTFKQQQVSAVIRSALSIEGIIAGYARSEAIQLLEAGHVLICAGGTGSPLVTTDSAAALRAIELNADILLKATKVDGVYSADPMQDAHAELFTHLTYQQVIEKNLQVMDLSAFSLCRDHKMPIRVFNMEHSDTLRHALLGEACGTLIDAGDS